MKKLLFNNETIKAEKIVKTSDSIIGYNGNSEVFVFRGVSDFSLFTLEEGQDWDIEINEIEQLKISQAEQFETILEILGGIM